MPKEIFAELYVCWKCGNVSVDRDACSDCGGEMEFTYFVPESRPTTHAADPISKEDAEYLESMPLHSNEEGDKGG